MNFYIAQAVGLVITGLAIAVQHFKKMQLIVWIEFLMNVLTAVQYGLLGGLSGAYVSIAAIVHTTALMLYDKFGDPEKRKICPPGAGGPEPGKSEIMAETGELR